jgi:hypothetical protein
MLRAGGMARARRRAKIAPPTRWLPLAEVRRRATCDGGEAVLFSLLAKGRFFFSP